MTLRLVGACLMLSLILLGGRTAWSGDWTQFKADFLSSDGRVIDIPQDQRSHSEGQGYGLLLAVSHDDRTAFDLIWTWTRNNLQVRESDRLLAWAWGPKADGQWTVLDNNNATDGDQLAAWALLIAHERWGENDYRDQALEIIAAIREHLIRNQDGLACILPGYFGFDSPKGLVLNPSYFIFPALEKFAVYDQKDFWKKVHQDSLTLLAKSLFSDLKLPADWVRMHQGRVEPETDRSSVFGFEAIRVPLYLAWDRHLDALPELNRVLDVIDRQGQVPQWFNIVQPCVSLVAGPAGFQAVMALAAAQSGRKELARSLWDLARTLGPTEKQNYYSRVLCLLAATEIKP